MGQSSDRGFSRLFLRLDFGGQGTHNVHLGAPIFRATRFGYTGGPKPPPGLLSDPRQAIFADPSTSLISISVFDCTVTPAPGVEFELVPDAPSAMSFYGPGLLDTTETSDDPTGGFVGVPEGFFGVRARRASDGERLAAMYNVQVWPGQTTVAILFPDTTGGR